ncbi:MAG: PAS domain S-box protein, partial [Rhodospirillaceae bacterium]
MAGSFSYQQLFDSNPQPMWIYDLESLAILKVNNAAVQCYGYSRDEFRRLTISDIRPAEDVPALRENVSRVTEGLDRAGIWRHRHKDGRIVSVEITSHSLEFDGRPAELVMAVDVTERVEADDRLRRTRALMRAAGRIARVGGWLLDVETMTLEWSDEIREIHELPPGRTPSVEEALGFYAPEWRDRARTLLESCMRDGTPFHEEMEIVTAAGRRFWVRTSGEAVRDGRDRVAYIEGAVQNITGEHEARRWSEERLRQFLDAVPAPIWSAQPDGALDYANRILYDYVGLTPESFHPSAWPDLVHPEDRERAKAVSDAAYRAGASYACELRLRRRDGAWRWHLDAGAPLRDERGNIVKYYGTVTEIHDIKAAETALREREARLSAIIEHEPECVKVVSPDGLLREMNPAGLRMIEAGSRDEAVGRRVADLVHPDEREIFQALHRDALGGLSGEATFRIVGLKGTERWVESHSAPLMDADGQPEAVLSVTRDITARHRAEAELLEAMKRNELILASSAEGIHGLDADGRIMFENVAGAEILGFDADDLIGRKSHPLIHHHRANGEAYPVEACPIYRTLRDGRTRHVENEVFFRKDGKSVPVEYTVAAMVDSDSGAVSGAVVNFRDVTGPKRDADLHALESHVLEMVSVGTPLGDILGEIAETVDRLLDGVRSSVMLVERDLLRVGAAPRMPAAFCSAIDGIEIREGSGPCGTAAARRQVVIVSDARTDPLCADYRELVEEYGLRACWSVPVMGAGGDVLATFAIYCGEPRGPEDAELAFVARVGQYVLMAIERHAAAEALRASEERLRILAENVEEVLWMTTPLKDRMIYVSPAYEAIWGRNCEALYAEPREWMDAIHPED